MQLNKKLNKYKKFKTKINCVLINNIKNQKREEKSNI